MKPIKEIAPRENDVVRRGVLVCIHRVNRRGASSPTLTARGNLADGVDVSSSQAASLCLCLFVYVRVLDVSVALPVGA